MEMQVVIDSLTKEVLRFGFADFANDGKFDPNVEEVIEKDAYFPDAGKPGVKYFWNTETKTFDKVVD